MMEIDSLDRRVRALERALENLIEAIGTHLGEQSADSDDHLDTMIAKAYSVLSDDDEDDQE